MAEDTITQAELAEAIKGWPVYGKSVIMAGDPAEVAADIFRHVAEHREPEYQPGCAYQADDGLTYLRSSIRDWVDRSGGRWPDAAPIRPLRKLVPEGSQAAGLDLEAVRYVVNLGILCHETPIEIARRIGKLIEGAGS